MTSNNQVSSMLLLILIGVAIYFLCYSEGFSESKHKEYFADLKLDDSKQSDDIIGNISDSTLYSLPLNTQSEIQPNISNDDITQIINSEVKPIIEKPVIEKPVIEKPVIEKPVIEKPVIERPVKQVASESLMNDFTPNDDMLNDFGFELNSAFTAPLPPGTNPEVVDFKKINNDNYNAKDFLPKQINDEWFETDFSLAKYQLNDDKLINTERYMIGINTVGQSLKNATYDIRGTIANPKLVVSPWNNSTYEPDFNLKPLC
jgi:hypothetical protein